MPIVITRHYLTINKRRVHYRRAGKGPPLLMVHQSPRSSAEYEPLMLEWADHFTCIAPDTAGFGQSHQLAKPNPDIYDYAEALVEFVRALGLERVAAYGFHSGANFLIAAMRRYPGLFTAIGAGGLAIWTDAERAAFGEGYAPPFPPQSYGEHLVWAWNRVLEQGWFFPWYDVRPETRMKRPHCVPENVNAITREILDAGEGFPKGYNAVLQSHSDVPAPDTKTPPVLITAYDSDPIQAHIDRLPPLPANWDTRKVAMPPDQNATNLAFLNAHAAPEPEAYAEDADRGFVSLSCAGFDGLIHWHGNPASKRLQFHAPGAEADLLDGTDAICVDLPGHGLSSSWPGNAPTDWANWQQIIDALTAHFGTAETVIPAAPDGDPEQLFPDLTPDRFGGHLTKGWAIVRAQHFFAPWYVAAPEKVIAFDPDDITPDRLAQKHRALMRATSARAYAIALKGR